jgi:hypothetical protein
VRQQQIVHAPTMQDIDQKLASVSGLGRQPVLPADGWAGCCCVAGSAKESTPARRRRELADVSLLEVPHVYDGNLRGVPVRSSSRRLHNQSERELFGHFTGCGRGMELSPFAMRCWGRPVLLAKVARLAACSKDGPRLV